MAENKNVIKYHRSIHFNIGFVIFFIIILYVAFYLFSYFTSDSVAVYEVTQGTIASNHIYKGLILRDETVYTATQSGYINYYLKNASKAAVNDVVYSIDTNGTLAAMMEDAERNGNGLDKEELSKISAQISTFALNYDSISFSSVYAFQYDLNSELQQALNSAALSEIADEVSKAEANNTFYEVKAGAAGVVLYYMDGLESLTWEEFTAEDYNFSGYNKTSLESNTQVNASDPVFKMVNSESWSVVIPISNDLAEALNSESSLKVRFCKDNYTTTASFYIAKKSGEYYLNLCFNSGMIRYANERYIDVELVLDVEEGLKIPNSSITEKEFFTIPIECFMKGEDSNAEGILIKSQEDDSLNFVTPTIYYSTETAYYIDSEYVSEGDMIQMADSGETYTVGTDKDVLQGVYNVNKGYAVFKQIDIIYQNDEYTIVRQKTSYGISLYDHIALDGSKVTENQFTTK